MFLFLHKLVNTLWHFEQGQATDIQIQAEEILKLKKQINKLYVKHTGQALDAIGELWLNSSAVQLNIAACSIDSVILPTLGASYCLGLINAEHCVFLKLGCKVLLVSLIFCWGML